MAFARTTALEFLRRAHEQNRLAHAYLITGAPGSGKELLAAELASLVNGTASQRCFFSQSSRGFHRPSRIEIAAHRHRADPGAGARASDASSGWPAQSSDRSRRRPASNRGGKRLSQDTGRTAKGFAVAFAERIAGGSAGNDSLAVHFHSTCVRRRASEQERARETREIAATSIPPNDLEYSICLSTCSGISTTAPGST